MIKQLSLLFLLFLAGKVASAQNNITATMQIKLIEVSQETDENGKIIKKTQTQANYSGNLK